MSIPIIRIKTNQPVPVDSVVISILERTDQRVAVVGRYVNGPGGAGWVESESTDVAGAIEAASAEAGTQRDGVVFVYFSNTGIWDPKWGEWTWLRRSHPQRAAWSTSVRPS